MGEKKTSSEQKKKNKRNRLNLRIDDDELALLNTIMFEDDLPVSQVVRKAIKVYGSIRRNKNTPF